MPQRISEAELEIMEALWTEAPLSAAQVAERIDTARGWSMQTVKTMLSRLVSKAALSHERDGRRFLYSPLIARSDYVAGESRRLVDRLFGGRIGPLVAHLAERDDLAPADIEEIEKLIEELKS